MGCCASQLGLVSRAEFMDLKRDVEELKRDVDELKRDVAELKSLKRDMAELKTNLAEIKKYARIRRMYFCNRHAEPIVFMKNCHFIRSKFGIPPETYRALSLFFFDRAERIRRVPRSSTA